MKLFLVSRTDEHDYDEFDSFVIACETEDEAKTADPFNGEPFNWGGHWSITDHWCDSIDKVMVQYLGEADNSVKQGIVCSSFNAA